MATHTGKSGIIKVGASAVGEVRDWSLEVTGETAETTTMGDSWRSYSPTLNTWTSSFNAYWDEGDAGQSALAIGSSITLELYPEGTGSTATYWTGTAIVTSISKSASFDGLVEASFSVQGDGSLTESTVA